MYEKMIHKRPSDSPARHKKREIEMRPTCMQRDIEMGPTCLKR